MRRLKSGEIVAPATGLYARAEWWNALSYERRGWCVARTMSAIHPDWIFAGTYAAWIYGFTTTYNLLHQAQKLIPRHSNSRNEKGVKAFYSTDEDLAACRTIRGFHVSDPYKTIFDCARTLTFADALPLCDAALRSGMVKQEELIKFVMDRKRCKGWREALRVAQYASPLAENGGESTARAWMIELGFMVPQLQVPFPDKDGTVHRVDFYWRRDDGREIIGEHDGMVKYTDPKMMHGKTAAEIIAEEKKREDRLSVYGVWIVRFTPEVMRDRRAFAARLELGGVPRARR